MRARTKLLLAGCAAVIALAVPASASATTHTFTVAAGPNAVPATGDSGPAGMYPWNVVVSGLPGVTDDVNVTLKGVAGNNVTDIDALLVPPNGAKGTLFLSDAGDSSVIAPPGVDVTFDDSAATSAPVAAPLTSGTYKPTNADGLDADTFVAPAPAGPYGATLATANGFNPNGTWSIYLTDDDTGVATIGSVQSAALTVSTNSNGNFGGPKAKKHGNNGQRKRKCKKHFRGNRRHHKCHHKHHHGQGQQGNQD